MQWFLQPWPFDFLFSLVNLISQGLGPLLQSGRGMQLGLYKIYFLKVIPFVQIQIWRIFCYNNSLSLTNLILFCCRYVDGQDYMESVANAIMKVMDTYQSLIFSFEKTSQTAIFNFSVSKKEENQILRQKRRFSSQTGGWVRSSVLRWFPTTWF